MKKNSSNTNNNNSSNSNTKNGTNTKFTLSAKPLSRRSFSGRLVPLSAAGLSLILFGTAALTGCGSSSASSVSSTYDSSTVTSYYNEGYTVDSYDYDYAEEAYNSTSATADYDNSGAVLDGNADYGQNEKSAAAGQKAEADQNSETDSSVEQKLIVTWNIGMETEHYEDAVSQIRTSVSNAGGYIESEYEYSYDENSHYESLTIRIPQDKADEWLEGVSSYGTITDRSKSCEDITLTYVDTQSRLTALRTEQQTLLNMMEKAETITDLIAIQTELTNVNADIESYESQLRVMDNQVNYTTVYLNISEVKRETAVVMTFWDEVKETFLNSMDGLEYYAREIAVGILGNSVIIIIVAAAFAVLVWSIKKITRRIHKAVAKKKHKAASEMTASEMTASDATAAEKQDRTE